MSTSGEGSRGGHVIGHTASGKAIYGPPRDASTPHDHVNRTSAGFSAQDHRDASWAMFQAKVAHGTKGSKEYTRWKGLMDEHASRAEALESGADS